MPRRFRADEYVRRRFALRVVIEKTRRDANERIPIFKNRQRRAALRAMVTSDAFGRFVRTDQFPPRDVSEVSSSNHGDSSKRSSVRFPALGAMTVTHLLDRSTHLEADATTETRASYHLDFSLVRGSKQLRARVSGSDLLQRTVGHHG